MYELITKALKERKNNPVKVAIVGSGWFGGGLARELYRIDGTSPVVLMDKLPERCVNTYLEMGIKKGDIAVVKNPAELKRAEKEAKYIVFSQVDLLNELKDIDIIFEATGDVPVGVKAALASIEKKIPFVSANFEMDAVVGLRLANLAKEKGSLYCNADGDQPSCLSRMINEISLWGFEPKIAGNCKAFMDLHQNPTGVKPYVPSHQDNHMVCGMADGTKQSIEMAVLGNAFGYYTLKRGMYGPTTTKLDLIKTFDDLVGLKSLKGTYVDFVFGIKGIDQGAGVFIIAHREGQHVADDMKFLKKGDGPFYLFFRDHHLCYFEAISSIAETALFGISTFFPKGRFVDVITVAKRDIEPGKKLDGIGGYDCYGLAERAAVASREDILPIGLAGFATATKKIAKDSPVTYGSVELEDNQIVRLRKEQDQLPVC
ncbi:MAG: hypothetical protein JW994_05980 [Candidatus Omnitrophica bacterium]|nr:hypothetical protein [Candidatus Omnitrophota bacterium]